MLKEAKHKSNMMMNDYCNKSGLKGFIFIRFLRQHSLIWDDAVLFFIGILTQKQKDAHEFSFWQRKDTLVCPSYSKQLVIRRCGIFKGCNMFRIFLARFKCESVSEVTFDSRDLLSHCVLPHTGLQQLKGLKWDPEQVLKWERREFRRICPASLPASFISTLVPYHQHRKME